MHLPPRIVLVETSHPGNIGASARAMKTMGLADLTLVAPGEFPSAEATARASGADDVLARARVVATLSEAIADCGFIVGASARLRSLPWPTVDPRACARSIRAQAASTPVALVFGPEHSGLTNEDLGRCHQLVNIPANPEYASLNLAMAVQVLCYELRMAYVDGSPVTEEREAPPASAEELEGLHRHLDTVLSAAGFLNPDHPRQLKLRLRRIFNRSQLDRNEVNILRGMLAALDPAHRGGAGGRG
jgi:TrmH family RNA methyltransferase